MKTQRHRVKAVGGRAPATQRPVQNLPATLSDFNALNAIPSVVADSSCPLSQDDAAHNVHKYHSALVLQDSSTDISIYHQSYLSINSNSCGLPQVRATTLGSPATPTAGIDPPTGYPSSQLIFEDTFASASLNTTKWNAWEGDDIYGRYSDNGFLPSPYSAPNSGAAQIQYFDPYPYGYDTNTTGDHLVGGGAGNLALVAQPSSYFSDLGYSWASGGISSYGHAYLPATGGYVQWNAKMPDSRYGAWAELWLISSNGPELDVQESGYLSGSTNPNDILASNWHGAGGSQIIQDTGTDLSAGYHTYGVEYIPGQSWMVYLDGKVMATWTENVPTNAAYQVNIDLAIGGPMAAAFHTVADEINHPGPFELNVNDVQIYSSIACFCRGTLILSDRGGVPVEDLVIGDPVMTLSGAPRPIKWIGKRAYDGRFIAGSRAVLPIRIIAGALAEGVPARDLLVSPEHALYLHGRLVPARLLINGATIIQIENLDRLEYFHIELDGHDVIIAEGAAIESFVDCDNRRMFQNWSEFAVLYPGCEPVRWQFFMPHVSSRDQPNWS